MIYVEITLSNEYTFICFAPSMFVFLNCFATGWCKVSLIALVLSWLHWLFSSVRFQMNLQIVGLSRCKVTSVAFVWLYRASVRFQMSLQTEWSRCSKITLAAFVRLFDTVCFQMSPQIACLRRCIVTLVAFVWLFSNVCFRNEPSNCIFEKMPVTPVAIIVFVSTLCIVTPWLLLFFLFFYHVFSNDSSNHLFD